ncbi:hypothetical protein SAMN03080610_00261 [Afifella marina DSM 2698]|uniref:Uncharacterized protein n=1 Tax=Afifella marina DSM 2698 TaxID=1120955 RepID=A0A1G5MAI7_AFIMA|nr:hypothetical protein SAMN03080610_00261 [Afifella marina DSM 2698]
MAASHPGRPANLAMASETDTAVATKVAATYPVSSANRHCHDSANAGKHRLLRPTTPAGLSRFHPAEPVNSGIDVPGCSEEQDYQRATASLMPVSSSISTSRWTFTAGARLGSRPLTKSWSMTMVR